MKKYQYQIVRYIHDLVSSEFVNVGIIVYQPEIKYLSSKFINKYSRISQFYDNVNGYELISTLKQFNFEINKISKQFEQLFFDEYSSLEGITNSILPKDDSSIVCSELLFAIDIDPDKALEDLFSRYVNKYISESDKEVQTDSKVWSKVYKQYFDKYEITSKLKPHTVKTSHDSIEFDRAWKNGAWNCFQTLSFDLRKTDAIKNKVYKWSGILSELENSEEKLHIYLLTNSPKKDGKIRKFIEDTLTSKESQSLQVTLINEKEADKFAKFVKREIEEHSH